MELAERKEENKMGILREKQKESGVGLLDDGDIFPMASNSRLCSTRRQEEIVWVATKAL